MASSCTHPKNRSTVACSPSTRSGSQALFEELQRNIPAHARLVCPLTFGNHVDHQLTRAAAERLGQRLWYYADYPYVARRPAQLAELAANGWRARRYRVSEARA